MRDNECQEAGVSDSEVRTADEASEVGHIAEIYDGLDDVSEVD